MRYKLLFASTLLLFFSGLTAQTFSLTKFQTSAMATYKFMIMPDTTDRGTYRTTDLLLFLSSQGSFCISKERYNNDSLQIDVIKEIEKVPVNSIDVSSLKIPKGYKSTSSNYLIKKELENKIITYFSNIGLQEYYYTEPMSFTNWKLLDEQVNYMGIDCKVAKREYLGRNYLVYYAPGIPFQDGPLKFAGLPGLILFVEDDLKEVKISLTSFTPTNRVARFLQSYQPIKTERKKMNELAIQYFLDPFTTDEQMFNIKIKEESKIQIRKRREEAMKKVNNRVEKD